MRRTEGSVRLHGLDLSYFTGKVEAYLRAKGIPYELVEMDTRRFARCARITGAAQMPQLELPDGTWLTDSTHIIEQLEQRCEAPRVYPQDPALCYIAHLPWKILPTSGSGARPDSASSARFSR